MISKPMLSSTDAIDDRAAVPLKFVEGQVPRTHERGAEIAVPEAKPNWILRLLVLALVVAALYF